MAGVGVVEKCLPENVCELRIARGTIGVLKRDSLSKKTVTCVLEMGWCSDSEELSLAYILAEAMTWWSSNK